MYLQKLQPCFLSRNINKTISYEALRLSFRSPKQRRVYSTYSLVNMKAFNTDKIEVLEYVNVHEGCLWKVPETKFMTCNEMVLSPSKMARNVYAVPASNCFLPAPILIDFQSNFVSKKQLEILESCRLNLQEVHRVAAQNIKPGKSVLSFDWKWFYVKENILSQSKFKKRFVKRECCLKRRVETYIFFSSFSSKIREWAIPYRSKQQRSCGYHPWRSWFTRHCCMHFYTMCSCAC